MKELMITAARKEEGKQVEERDAISSQWIEFLTRNLFALNFLEQFCEKAALFSKYNMYL